MSTWEVIVDNVGICYSGEDEEKARKAYATYCENTQGGFAGWGLSKGCSLWQDGEPVEEFVVGYATIVSPKRGVIWSGEPVQADNAFKMLRNQAMEDSTPIALLIQENDPEQDHPYLQDWWSPNGVEEPIRVWIEPGEAFFLAVWDKNIKHHGRRRLSYQFWHKGQIIFAADDFSPSPMHADDSDETVGSLLGFLSLRPGDTDKDYFDDYSPRQLEWACRWGETLSVYAHELEN